MMRGEANKAAATARSAGRSSSWKSGNVGCGLIFGFLVVLLYLIVSAQLSYNPHDAAYVRSAAAAAAATTSIINAAHNTAVSAKRERTSRQEQDVGDRGMEEEEERRRRSEEAEARTEPSATNAARLKGEKDWADKNPIEERSGNERNSDDWEKTQRKPEEKDAVEFPEFGGGTDDFNNVARTNKPLCDTSFGKYDICELSGDVRTRGGPGSATVTVVSPRAPPREWRIKPYSRKYLDGLKAVTVRSVPAESLAPPCTARARVPAMVIELGGLTGNYWHDFTDVLVPLFAGARRFGGEVQLLVVNLLPFWVDKYRRVFRQLTRHELVDFDRDDGVVRCYPHVVVGYGSRKEFTIDPALDATGGNNYTMVDFTGFLRQAYDLPRHRPINLSSSRHQRPRMMILERTNSRRLLNLPEVVAAAEAAGFQVTVAGARPPKGGYDAFAREVNSFDAMVGVHGAGLTNCVFLPTGAVLVQIVPYGRLEDIARTDFGDPARDMGLRYLEYGVAADESSLMDMFGKDHPIVSDPVAVHLSGWGNVAEWYLGKQDVRINVERFRPVLEKAMDQLR